MKYDNPSNPDISSVDVVLIQTDKTRHFWDCLEQISDENVTLTCYLATEISIPTGHVSGSGPNITSQLESKHVRRQRISKLHSKKHAAESQPYVQHEGERARYLISSQAEAIRL